MLKEKHLKTEDQLIYNLYKKLNMEKAEFVLLKDSIKEEEKGIQLTIVEPITEWTNTNKIKKEKKKNLLITKSGNIEVLSEKEDNKKEETIDNYLSKINYRIEPCTNELIRMTKETTTIDFKVQGNSLEKVKSINPTIIYFNHFGQVLDIISLNKKEAEKTKVYKK